MPLKDLNEKQKKFCREYIYDFNGTRAYLEAYPDSSEEAARSSASDLLTKPNIKAHIDDIKNKLEENAGISRLKVLNEHMKLAFSSIAHMHNTWVERKKFDELTDEQKSCIAEIQTQTGETGEMVKIKLYDKQKSLDAISKMLGYNEAEKVQVENIVVDFPDDE